MGQLQKALGGLGNAAQQALGNAPGYSPSGPSPGCSNCSTTVAETSTTDEVTRRTEKITLFQF